jgi:hypothetical protein
VDVCCLTQQQQQPSFPNTPHQVCDSSNCCLTQLCCDGDPLQWIAVAALLQYSSTAVQLKHA